MSYLSVTRGDDETLDIVVTDSDTGALVALTGATLRFMVKAKPGDANADALISKSTSSGITIAPDQVADKGEATITIADTDTDDLDPGAYFWELEATQAGLVSTLASGRFAIIRDIVAAGA